VDFFEKAEWKDVRSLTWRITISDEEKTLSGEEIDTIVSSIILVLTQAGGTIR